MFHKFLAAPKALWYFAPNSVMKRPHIDMKSYLAYLATAALVGSLQLVSAADLTGKVKLKGTPPPAVKIDLSPGCGKLQPNGITTRHYVVGADGGLANVFVYVKEGAKPTPATAAGPVLDQVGCEYQPYVIGITAGQNIKVKNSDPELHNVNATPKVAGNKPFNFAQVKDAAADKTFDKPEVMVRLMCNVHPWMFAYVGVCDHPYFAVTDKDGNFTIKGLPPGKYTVEAFHLKAGAKTQEVMAGDNKPVDFTLEVPVK